MADRSESSACSFFCWGAAPKLFRSDPLQKETNTGSAAASRGAGPARTLCLHTLLPSVWGLPFFSWDRVSLSSLGWPEIYREPPASASQLLGLKVVTRILPGLPHYRWFLRGMCAPPSPAQPPASQEANLPPRRTSS